MMSMQENWDPRKIFDIQNGLDMDLLVKLIDIFYNGKGKPQSEAAQILNEFRNVPGSWMLVENIISSTESDSVRFYALQLLETAIKTRWHEWSKNNIDTIKNYLLHLMMSCSENAQVFTANKVFLQKVNQILVLIVRRIWPHDWPSLIDDLMESSKSNEIVCMNNMNFIKQLSQDIFDFNSGQITQVRARYLRDCFCEEFSKIFNVTLCVLQNCDSSEICTATLSMIYHCLHWVPLHYMFSTNILEILTKRFLNVDMFRNIVVQCLTEIVSISTDGNYEQQMLLIFVEMMNYLQSIIPTPDNVLIGYQNGNYTDQKFVQNISMFLVVFLRQHSSILEKSDLYKDRLTICVEYLLNISLIEDKEIFKICLEYWHFLAYRCYAIITGSALSYCKSTFGPNFLVSRRNPFALDKSTELSVDDFDVNIYSPMMNNLRYLLITHMEKPEEVIVVENDQGEVVRETMQNTDSINIYKTMREALVYLTHADPEDTTTLMNKGLCGQVRGEGYSWNCLNRLCWAIGSISGALSEESEKSFLVGVIKELLNLCESKPGKDNKAIIASNIMYVVGQYPRFLRCHWRFNRTVVNKLIEFMHETHEGVQDMAVDTFIKIARRCRRSFVIINQMDDHPAINDYITSLYTTIKDMQPHQIYVYYETLSIIISAQTHHDTRDDLIKALLNINNSEWTQLLQGAARNLEVLKTVDSCTLACHLLKINMACARGLPTAFTVQMKWLLSDLESMYKVMSTIIHDVMQQGSTRSSISKYRHVKVEILKLITTWLENGPETALVMEHFLPQTLKPIIDDYKSNNPEIREYQVLTLIKATINVASEDIKPYLVDILKVIYPPTITMISADYKTFPDHRKQFFLLIKEIVRYCFDSLLSLDKFQMQSLLEAIIMGMGQEMRCVSDMSVDLLNEFFTFVKGHNYSQKFYHDFYLTLLINTLSILTNSSTISSLTGYANLLSKMFLILETGQIQVYIGDDESISTLELQKRAGQFSKIVKTSASYCENRNALFLIHHISSNLKAAYAFLLDEQLIVFMDGLLAFNNDIEKFKENIRDFLIQIRENNGFDIKELFTEQLEDIAKAAQHEKLKKDKKIPGLVKPSIDGDMND